MTSKTNSIIERWADWANIVLALALFSAPWWLGFIEQVWLARSDWVAAAIVAMLAVAALTKFQDWEEWINVLVGLWVAASPWVFGVTTLTAVLWTHVAIGLAVASLAAWRSWSGQGSASVSA